MLRVNRSDVPLPAILESSRVREARRSIEEILTLPDQERLQRRAPYRIDLIRSKDFLDSLGKLFANKCAYCESELILDAEIDHFRPFRVAQEESGYPTYF